MEQLDQSCFDIKGNSQAYMMADQHTRPGGKSILHLFLYSLWANGFIFLNGCKKIKSINTISWPIRKFMKLKFQYP